MKKIFILTLCLSFIFLCCCNKKTKKIPQEQKIIYLTFDDGPTTNTLNILQILSQYKVKATFFVVGDNICKYPQTLKEIYKQNHSIGIHSFSHKYKQIYSNVNALLTDIELCLTEIKKIIPAYDKKIYRFPGGSFGLKEDFKRAVLSKGYSYYDWNASTLDAEGNFTPYEIFNNVKKTALNKNRIILLCHDQKTCTTLALKDIILYYKNNGYAFGVL